MATPSRGDGTETRGRGGEISQAVRRLGQTGPFKIGSVPGRFHGRAPAFRRYTALLFFLGGAGGGSRWLQQGLQASRPGPTGPWRQLRAVNQATSRSSTFLAGGQNGPTRISRLSAVPWVRFTQTAFFSRRSTSSTTLCGGEGSSARPARRWWAGRRWWRRERPSSSWCCWGFSPAVRALLLGEGQELAQAITGAGPSRWIVGCRRRSRRLNNRTPI